MVEALQLYVVFVVWRFHLTKLRSHTSLDGFWNCSSHYHLLLHLDLYWREARMVGILLGQTSMTR